MKTMVIYLKRIVMCSLMFVVVNAVLAQDYQTKHEVQRGETLASIAKQYGVTEQMIKDVNPQMGDLFYVGLKLNIPNKIENHQQKADVKFENEKSIDNNVVEYKKSYKKVGNTELYAGISLNTWVGDDAKDSKNNIGFHIGMLRRYFLLKTMFVEAGLSFVTKGYKSDMLLTSGQYWDDEGANYDYDYHYKMQTYNIEIPISIGYNFKWNSGLSVYIKGGAYATYALSGKLKLTGTETDYDDIHSSATGKINKETKIGDIKGYNEFGYGLQAGIVFRYDNYLLNFTYQRGLSKLMEKQKTYEQNLLLSLGYKF